MSIQKLPQGHPLAQPLPAGVSPFDVAAQLIAFRRGFSGPLGMTMLGDDDEEDEEEDEDDEQDPDETVKVGDKTFKVSQLQTIMAREKRQGARSGRTALVKDLGFDNVDDLKAALAAAKPAKKVKADEDDDASEAAAQAAERERKAAEAERKANEKARNADLRGALVSAGVTDKDDLRDALVLLDRAVDAEYDDDDLDEQVEKLKERRPFLFGVDEDEEEAPAKPPKATLPAGGSRKRAKQQKVFGAGGLDRAKRNGWVKS